MGHERVGNVDGELGRSQIRPRSASFEMVSPRVAPEMTVIVCASSDGASRTRRGRRSGRSTAQQPPIARRAGGDPHRRHCCVRGRVHRRGSVGRLVGIHSNDHDSVLGRQPLSTTAGTPTSRPTKRITPLLSQTAASRQPGGTPWQSQPKRQAVHEPTRPTTYRTLRPLSHTDRSPHTSLRFSSDCWSVLQEVFEQLRALALAGARRHTYYLVAEC